MLTARLFEAGACFSGSQETVEELPFLSLGLTGAVPAAPPVMVAADAPFFELKGVLEAVFQLFDCPPVSMTAHDLPQAWEPGRSAAFVLDGKAIGYFGQLSQAETTRRKLRQPVYLAELALAGLLKFPLRSHTARELSRFQAVERDFSFIFPNAVVWAQVEATIKVLGIAELQRLQPVEVWRDRKFPGVYSLLTRATFQSADRTLGEAELTEWWAAIISALEALGGVIRDGAEKA